MNLRILLPPKKKQIYKHKNETLCLKMDIQCILVIYNCINREQIIFTACTVSIVAEISFQKLLLNSCFLPHFADLGHAEFGVQAEIEFSSINGEIVLGPVPQKLEMLVIQGSKGIHAEDNITITIIISD